MLVCGHRNEAKCYVSLLIIHLLPNLSLTVMACNFNDKELPFVCYATRDCSLGVSAILEPG